MTGALCCRDVDLVKAGEVVQNVICCGHSQSTSIQRMAFSPNDSILVGPQGSLGSTNALSAASTAPCLWRCTGTKHALSPYPQPHACCTVQAS